MSSNLEIFISYSHEDKVFLEKLITHLSLLKRENIIKTWHDREITAGKEFASEIDKHLSSANIILLLVSADFLSSEYCYSVEMKKAMARHETGQARIIPVIIRECDWQNSDFGNLEVVPTDGKPVKAWDDPDRAYKNIIIHIRDVVKELSEKNEIQEEKPVNKVNILNPTLIAVLEGHTDWVMSTKISNDNQYIISCSNDKTIRIWDRKTSKQLKVIQGHKGQITDVAISTDNKFLYSASGGGNFFQKDNTIRIWDTYTGRQLNVLTSHNDIVRSIALSRDTKYIVSGSNDKTLKIWDATTGEEFCSITTEYGFIERVVISNDNKYIVYSSRNTLDSSNKVNTTIKVIDRKAWKLTNTIESSGICMYLAISNSNDFVAFGCNNEIKVCYIKLDNKTETLSGHDNLVSSLVITSDDKYIISGSTDKTIRVWDRETCEQVDMLLGHKGMVSSLAISSDDKFVVSGSTDNKVRIWTLM